ncbi:MAG: hypothetical protein V4510_09180 [bacterium]
MRISLLTIVAIGTLLAGCGSTTPVTPGAAAGAWSAWGGPAVEEGRTYGFIPVGPDGYGPTLPYVGLDRDGHVLYVGYQIRMNGNGASESAVIIPQNLSQWRPIVEPLFSDGTIYGAAGGPDGVRIVEVRTATLSASDRDAAWRAIDAALARAQDPKPVGIADCGEVIVRAGDRMARLNCGQGDDGWMSVIQQMDLLRDWIKPRPG